jgi:CSLREA domain-containing protein
MDILAPLLLGAWHSYLRALTLLLAAVVAVSLLVLLVGNPGPTRAASTFTVNSTADTAGHCSATPTNCTLRQAIKAANASLGVADTITFSVSGITPLSSTLPDMPIQRGK